MLSIAEKFRSIGKMPTGSGRSSSIFGAAGTLSQTIASITKARIGFYPIIGAEEPEIAMGIASCLCYLLDQYRDVEVYRVFAKIESNNDDEITIDDSQFDTTHWEFEGLNENVTIAGRIEANVLHLDIDQSLMNNETEDVSLRYEFETLYSLINQLPQVAEDIMLNLKDDISDELIISYSKVADGHRTESFSEHNVLIENLFYWNLDLYLYLWGVEWEDDDIESQFLALIEIVEKTKNSFATWCINMVAKQVLQIGLDMIGDVLIPHISKVFKQDKELAITLIGNNLINLGYTEQALALIGNDFSPNSQDIATWLALIDIFSQTGQFEQAVDINQLAIENGIENERLYWRYMQLLNIAEANGWFVEELLLIDPDEFNESEHISMEIIASLENILELNAQNTTALYTLLPILVDNNDDKLWNYFRKFVGMDVADVYIQQAVGYLIDWEGDLQPAYDILSDKLQDSENNPFLLLSLAQVAIFDNDMSLAEDYLNSAEKYVDSFGDKLVVNIQQLRLSTAFPDFEHYYSEVNTILSANRNISEEHVGFLEDAIEIAPKISDLYVMLGRCYLNWKDFDASLEVLNEGLVHAGKHSRLYSTLARVYWIRGEKNLAFEQLNVGLRHYPNDIAILSQISNYLIDNNQLDDAKPYIERVDIIAPSHPELWNLKKRIADYMTKS